MIVNNPIIRDGTNQLARRARALIDGYVNIDERSPQELCLFLLQFARELGFYNTKNLLDGNWDSLLRALQEVDEAHFSDEQVPFRLLPIPVSTLVTLVKLFTYAQEELNQVTNKHLSYYYHQVLHTQAAPAVGDEVYVVLELAKSKAFQSYLMKTDVLFDGQKDQAGNPLLYKPVREQLITRAKIASVKSVFIEQIDNKSLIYAAPIANSEDGQSEAFEMGQGNWPTFGEVQSTKPTEERNMISPDFGFGLSSPALLLKEGTRSIALHIHFKEGITPNFGIPIQQAVEVFYTGEEAWETPSSFSASFSMNDDRWSLEISIHLLPDKAACTFYHSEIHGAGFDSPWPQVKIVLKPIPGAYDMLTNLAVSHTDIIVNASGMRNHLLQSDVSILDPAKPFLPFGSRPALNSRLYIGNAEIFQKRLDSLNLFLTWNDVPNASLGTHYGEYGSGVAINNNSFSGKIEMLLGRSWSHTIKENFALFDGIDATVEKEVMISDRELETEGYAAAPETEELSPYSVLSQRGFIRIELTGPLRNASSATFNAFGHHEFPMLYAQQAIALATYDDTSGDPEPQLPQQPYTPSLKEISLSYEASEQFVIGDGDSHHELFQLDVFGTRRIDATTDKLIAELDASGAMFIGLENLQPPINLSLLFHLDEGFSENAEILSPSDIQWSYLSNDQWIDLGDKAILSDDTEELQRSGIVLLSIPKDASSTHNLMPSDLHWLRVSIAKDKIQNSSCKGIYTNAVKAKLQLAGKNLDSHLANGLAAETITKTTKRIAELASVLQPFASIKGRASESPTLLQTRIHERLRHKKRAVQYWDYERLVLEAFPGVFKVKCLPHTSPDADFDPGSVTLVVVSNLRNKQSSNPFEPRTSVLVREEIQDFISQYTSPFVKVHVSLPIYESLLVEAQVGFFPDFDPGFYSQQLNDEIKQFLSPWAFSAGEDIEIGGAIYKSSILQFIESRHYVDFVVGFKLYHRNRKIRKPGVGEMCVNENFIIATPANPGINLMQIGSTLVIGEDTDIALADNPRSILVSALEHRIEPIAPGTTSCLDTSQLGIGFMSINIDFTIGNN